MASSSEPKQQNGQQRRPAYSNWPTVKIFLPPQGRFSKQTDEWCITYCSQSVSGRFHNKLPSCSSVCIRKVFPHEVKNILSYKRHLDVDAEGKAKYPLPPEGQPINVPRVLGGKKTSDPSDESSSSSSSPSSSNQPKYWEDGWYLWTTNSFFQSVEKISTMNQDFSRQKDYQRKQKRASQDWLEYQEFLERNGGSLDSGDLQEGESSKYWGAKAPPRPFPSEPSKALLVHLPPGPPPVWEKIDKLLAPSKRALELFSDDFSSGTHTEFAGRVWEKAGTNEPFVLAQRSWEKLCEAWKQAASNASQDDDKKRR